MRLRTTYPGFTLAVNTFFDKFIPKVVPLQVDFCHSARKQVCLYLQLISLNKIFACVFFSLRKGVPSLQCRSITNTDPLLKMKVTCFLLKR